MNITFERAVPADAETLRDVQVRAFHSDTLNYGVPLGGPPGYDRVDHVLEQMREEDYIKILADGQIVGGITVARLSEGHYHIDTFFIDPTYHNQGIGTQAMQFV